MKNSVAIGVSLFVLLGAGMLAQVPGPLKLIQSISLPGLKDGDFDHFQVDLPGQRLFLAAEDNSAVEVIDLRTNKVIHKITGRKLPTRWLTIPIRRSYLSSMTEAQTRLRSTTEHLSIFWVRSQ